MSDTPDRFPKIECPFSRVSASDSAKSYVTNRLKEDFRWILHDNTTVIEKLHGTNAAVRMDHGNVNNVAVRHGSRDMNELDPFGSDAHQSITRAVQNTINNGFLYQFNNGWIFGEVVGPAFHGNPYKLDRNLFIPFDWIREHCEYSQFPKSGFSDIENWLKDSIYSNFQARLEGKDPQDCLVTDGFFIEGVIFVKQESVRRIGTTDLNTESSDQYKSVTSDLAKLRRDMFKDIKVTDEFPDIHI